MRAVAQRVAAAAVEVDGSEVAGIGPGLLVYLGVGVDDGEKDALRMTEKLAGLRIFDDAAGRMNLSLAEVGGEALVVSQFTLYGDARKGRRPSYNQAAPPETARVLYERVAQLLSGKGIRTQTGRFGAAMRVSADVDGPVTILLDTSALF